MLPYPEQGKNEKETLNNLFDAYFKLRKELEWILHHLDNNNILEIDAAKIKNLEAQTATINELISEYIETNVIISNVSVTETLYAKTGLIADLTVNRLETSDKIQKYKERNTNRIDFIRIVGKNIDFVEATVKFGDPIIQLRNYNNELMYWIDETEKYMSTEITSYPVFIYDYDEVNKLQIFYELDEETGYYVPKMIWGAGDGVTEKSGKAEIVKDENGLSLTYFAEETEEERHVKLTNGGLQLYPFPIYETRNEDSVSVTSAAEVVATTIDIDFETYSKAIIQFSCEITIATGACDLTAKTYVDGVALTYQPTCYLDSANKFTFTYTDYCHDIAAGTKTVEVKLQTSANTGAIAIGHAVMVVTVFGEYEEPVLGTTALYSFGGISDGSTNLTDNDRYSPDTWVNKTDVPLPVRNKNAAFEISGVCFDLSGSTTASDNDAYTVSTDAWAVDTDVPSPSRTEYTASTILLKGYIYGGRGSSTLSDCDEYAAGAWTAKADIPSPARRFLMASTILSKGYIYAGYASSALADCDEYSPDTWTSKTNLPSPNRYQGAATTMLDKGYVTGGNDTAKLDCDEYSPDTWTSKTNLPSPNRSAHASSEIANKLYINGGAWLQDCDEYVVDTWTNKTDMPSPNRGMHTSVSS